MTLQRFLRKVRGDQSGFTLIELIVVVGIISLLAAVIVPNVGKFIGTGEDGAKDSEAISVQNALHAMMSETVISSVDACCIPNSSNDWTNKPTDPSGDALPLNDDSRKYLMAAETQYFYCYDLQGIITRQDEVATPC